MRLTVDLISNAPVFINALELREIDLRSHSIAVIENLSSSDDHFEVIDLSKNQLLKLDGFPRLSHLKMLLLSQNLISRIDPHIGTSLPNLTVLNLSSNMLEHLEDLTPLSTLTSLHNLSLINNPVTKIPNYLFWVVHLLPKLRWLDFRKVTGSQKATAFKIFGKLVSSSAASSSSSSSSASSSSSSSASESVLRVDASSITFSLPEAQKALLIEALKEATSYDQIARLEAAAASHTLDIELRELRKAKQIQNDAET